VELKDHPRLSSIKKQFYDGFCQIEINELEQKLISTNLSFLMDIRNNFQRLKLINDTHHDNIVSQLNILEKQRTRALAKPVIEIDSDSYKNSPTLSQFLNYDTFKTVEDSNFTASLQEFEV
jgi:hypothetical protein